MKNYILEACVDSVESAQAAQAGGANRLELCSNLLIGGTTPGIFLFQEVKARCSIGIHILIRPRFGDFCYTETEFAIMHKEIRAFREQGADGVVIGILKPDGSLHFEQMRELIKEAKGMSVTLHRAFDVCRDPFVALEQAKELGIKTILTSGQAETCWKGRRLLQELVRRAKGEIEIMAGGGVDGEILPQMVRETKIRTYHMSGKTAIDSPMQYRKKNVPMGFPIQSEYVIFRTEETKIRRAVEVLENIEED